MLGITRDITERQQLEAGLAQMADYDPLTGLANRTMFFARLTAAVEHNTQNRAVLGLLCVDLDGFKHVNDSLGHQAGDAVLRQVAERLQTCIRTTDMVARIGGDEFSVLLADCKESKHAAMVAERIRDSLAQSFYLPEGECMIGASIGISLYPHDAADLESFINHADMAMYAAKHQGKDTCALYQPLQ